MVSIRAINFNWMGWRFGIQTERPIQVLGNEIRVNLPLREYSAAISVGRGWNTIQKKLTCLRKTKSPSALLAELGNDPTCDDNFSHLLNGCKWIAPQQGKSGTNQSCKTFVEIEIVPPLHGRNVSKPRIVFSHEFGSNLWDAYHIWATSWLWVLIICFLAWRSAFEGSSRKAFVLPVISPQFSIAPSWPLAVNN
jgi:hypothetical protein